jgi:cytochrome c biogenesis protein CcmG/thiol:disulfide interchange protein DsbE
MKYKIQLFAALMLSVLTFSLLSCNKSEISKEQAQSALTGTSAMVSETTSTGAEALVYSITKVAPATEGKAVDFNWVDAGKTMSYSELTKGKVVLLNFWGTWCPPCRHEIPDLIKIATDLKNKNFVMMGVALERDQNGALKKVKSFAEAQKINYVLFVDDSREIVNAYGGINAVPTTYIIDKEGKIAETIVGMRDYNGFMESINRVLK